MGNSDREQSEDGGTESGAPVSMDAESDGEERGAGGRRTYPRLFAAASVEAVNGFSMLLTLAGADPALRPAMVPFPPLFYPSLAPACSAQDPLVRREGGAEGWEAEAERLRPKS